MKRRSGRRRRIGRKQIKKKTAGEKKANEMRQERKRLEWELARIQTQWKEKEIRRGNLQEQIDEFGPGEVQKTLEKQCRALDLAEEHLIRAGQEMSSRTVELRKQEGIGDIC